MRISHSGLATHLVKWVPSPAFPVGHDANSFHCNLDPVVLSIVSLTISLRLKFVKQISAKVTNTLLFFC